MGKLDEEGCIDTGRTELQDVRNAKRVKMSDSPTSAVQFTRDIGWLGADENTPTKPVRMQTQPAKQAPPKEAPKKFVQYQPKHEQRAYKKR